MQQIKSFLFLNMRLKKNKVVFLAFSASKLVFRTLISFQILSTGAVTIVFKRFVHY